MGYSPLQWLPENNSPHNCQGLQWMIVGCVSCHDGKGEDQDVREEWGFVYFYVLKVWWAALR